VNRKPGSKSWFFRSPPHFYFRFCLYGHWDGHFCLIFARTAQRWVLDGTNGTISKPCAYCWIVRSELKPEVVFKVQKMAWYASFCLMMNPFKGEMPAFAILWPVVVRVRVSFMTGAVHLAILATAGHLVDTVTNTVSYMIIVEHIGDISKLSSFFL